MTGASYSRRPSTAMASSCSPKRSYVPNWDAGRLVQVLPGYAAPWRPMYLLFSAGRPQTPKLRSFIDCVVGAFGPTTV